MMLMAVLTAGAGGRTDSQAGAPKSCKLAWKFQKYKSLIDWRMCDLEVKMNFPWVLKY